MPEVKYLVVDLPKETEQQEALLFGNGAKQWVLVAVDDGRAYFRKVVGEGENVPNDYGVSPADVLSPSPREGERVFNSVSSMDAGPDGVSHSHRVKLVVDSEMNVINGETSQVDGHSHPISMVGVTDEVDGHTHTFELFGM